MTRSLQESLGSHSPEQWARDFLTAAGFPTTPANVQAVVSWEYAESAGGGGMFNPLNTTQGGYAGESNFNTIGVKNFRTYDDGIRANVKVIHNGFYPRVVGAFLRGNSARDICDLITLSPWGTGPITLRGTPQPGTPQGKVEMQLIPSPHKPKLEGRQAAAVWSSALPNHVVLTNGASIEHDKPAGPYTRSWEPPITTGAQGIGIMPTIDRKGRPDGRGIVLQDSAGGTFVGLWS